MRRKPGAFQCKQSQTTLCPSIFSLTFGISPPRFGHMYQVTLLGRTGTPTFCTESYDTRGYFVTGDRAGGNKTPPLMKRSDLRVPQDAPANHNYHPVWYPVVFGFWIPPSQVQKRSSLLFWSSAVVPQCNYLMNPLLYFFLDLRPRNILGQGALLFPPHSRRGSCQRDVKSTAVSNPLIQLLDEVDYLVLNQNPDWTCPCTLSLSLLSATFLHISEDLVSPKTTFRCSPLGHISYSRTSE